MVDDPNFLGFGTIIFGSGGAGRTAASILKLSGVSSLSFLDDAQKNGLVNGIRVAGIVNDRYNYPNSKFLIAFGTRFLQEKMALFRNMVAEGFDFDNAIFPGLYIDETAVIGRSNVLAAGCKILPNVVVEDCCFFCVNSSADHDSRVSSGSYLAPGATLCGGVVLEEGSFIGANATILPEVRIGQYAIVGAGAVVAKDVPPRTVVVGIPARQRELK